MISFAFYGRVSAEENEDVSSSRNWQLARARELIEPYGVIVAEYFDVGQGRSLPWRGRPRANELLVDLMDPGRGFDAVVIGEAHRAFYGYQFGLVFALFSRHGVGLWIPELGGPVDPSSEAHRQIMSALGNLAQGESLNATSANLIKLRSGVLSGWRVVSWAVSGGGCRAGRVS
ncbi:recombinase family protein [Frankia sp. CNm7]|uniref:Recombinase family protein n=1 Tax=Frankia nepalensis TaxID=1836974 RepID=A0A937RGW7_9ACTN|nr:recombinase family protein [Frankia nepalensis]MBL7496914.1 recombinase family protein [Frankia nepalensis]MBL7508325.1 recombinase family protein [Frankia nepalensis]MBL7524413.1 recombinase family protein [Frankia nepalensis]MBL7626153.1 recombinase family protein [Frankia nepalensis]